MDRLSWTNSLTSWLTAWLTTWLTAQLKSAPPPPVFNDFDFPTALAPQRGANFVDLTFQKCSHHAILGGPFEDFLFSGFFWTFSFIFRVIYIYISYINLALAWPCCLSWLIAPDLQCGHWIGGLTEACNFLVWLWLVLSPRTQLHWSPRSLWHGFVKAMWTQ